MQPEAIQQLIADVKARGSTKGVSPSDFVTIGELALAAIHAQRHAPEPEPSKMPESQAEADETDGPVPTKARKRK